MLPNRSAVFLSLGFVVLLLSAPTDASNPGALKGKNKIQIAHCPLADHSLRSAIELVVKEELVPHLRRELRVSNPWDPALGEPEDPLACSLCIGASHRVSGFLSERFPHLAWEIAQTPSQNHAFNFCPELNLIIDTTYRQFLTHIPAHIFAELPPVFIGTPLEFKAFMKGKLSKHRIKSFLKAKFGPPIKTPRGHFKRTVGGELVSISTAPWH